MALDDFGTYYQNDKLETITREDALELLAAGMNVYVACGFGDDLDSRVEVVADEQPNYMTVCLWPMCAHHDWAEDFEAALYDAEVHASECTGHRGIRR